MDTIQLYIKVSKAHINVLKKKYSRPSCEQVRFVKMIQNRIGHLGDVAASNWTNPEIPSFNGE